MSTDIEIQTAIDRFDEQLQHASGTLGLDVATTASVVTSFATLDISSRMARIATISSRTLRALVEGLESTNENLNTLAEIAANPAAVRSDELRRRAAYAAEQGWNEEAQVDLAEAIVANPYDAISWYLLGRILLILNRPEESGEAYRKAARYVAPRSKSLAAFSILASAASFDEAELVGRAIESLRDGINSCAPCPELHLGLSMRTRDPGDLADAFELLPLLVLDAVVAGLEIADEAAAIALSRGIPERVELLQSQIVKGHSLLVRLGRDASIQYPDRHEPLDPSAGRPASLLAELGLVLQDQFHTLSNIVKALEPFHIEPVRQFNQGDFMMPTRLAPQPPPSGLSRKEQERFRVEADLQERDRYQFALNKWRSSMDDPDFSSKHAAWEMFHEEVDMFCEELRSVRGAPSSLIRPSALL